MVLTGMLRDAACGAQTGVTEDGGGGVVNAAGAEMFRSVPVFAPYGMCGVPPEGETALFLPLDGGAACVGVLCGGQGLAAGEAALYSAGGARLVLKNNGDIVLNGLTVTRDGQVIQKGARA